MKEGRLLFAMMGALLLAFLAFDLLYTSRFEARFKELERQRIITSNQLATAKIVSENLNHVRDLIFHNMDFSDQSDSLSQESTLFDFLTSCVNDLKLRLISLRPQPPTVNGRVTTYGYDIELQGDFFSFGEFCSKLENSRRVMAMTGFEVTQRKAGREDPPAAGSAHGTSASNKPVTIRLHLDTFRVRKAP